MAEHSVDLRSTLAVLRRKRLALVVVALLGVLAGVGYVMLWPPLYTSSSLVLLPPAQDGSGQAIEREIETVIQVARSDAVLGPAGKSLSPAMSARALGREVVVTAPSSDILKIETSGETASHAEARARAVASAEVAYVTEASTSATTTRQTTLARRQKELKSSLDTVNREIEKTKDRQSGLDPNSAKGKAEATALSQLTAEQANLVIQIDHLQDLASAFKPMAGATIIQDASPAKRPGLRLWYLGAAALGMLIAVVGTSIVLVLWSRRDRTLHYRDEIADAVGSPVVASIRSRVPRSVAGWTSLLGSYTPGTVDAWALRQTLRQLLPDDATDGPRRAAQGQGRMLHPRSIAVIALSDDLRGLAMGVQMASYTASAGVRTRLVPAQRHESAAALWAACAGVEGDEVRPGLVVHNRPGDDGPDALTVVLAVVDRRKPELVDLPRTAVTVLAVSSGSATAEDLARAAVTTDDAGRRIEGVVVADPDDLDRTTGRMLQQQRSQQVVLPTRLTGGKASKAGRTNVSGHRRRPG